MLNDTTDTVKPTPPLLPDDASPEIRELVEEQGVAETAIFEKRLGAGKDLWATDEEFDEFLQILRDMRQGRR